MWTNSFLRGVPFSPIVAPPVGMAFPTVPFTACFPTALQLNPASATDHRQPMFLPPLHLTPQTSINMSHAMQDSAISESTSNIFWNSQYHLYNQLMFQAIQSPIASHSSSTVSGIIESRESPEIPAAKYRLGPLDEENNSKELEKKEETEYKKPMKRRKKAMIRESNENEPSRKVHSPPLFGAVFSIQSPNAASTPLKALDTNEKRVNRSIRKDTVAVTPSTKGDSRSEHMPLDLRVSKRRTDNSLGEDGQQTKKRRLENPVDKQMVASNKIDTNKSPKLWNPVRGYHFFRTENLVEKSPCQNEIAVKHSAKKSGWISPDMLNEFPQPSPLRLNSPGFSLYSSPGYDSGVCLERSNKSKASLSPEDISPKFTDSFNSFSSEGQLVDGTLFCVSCESTFKDKTDAKCHVRDNPDHVMKKRCNICDKDFILNSDLCRHVMETHKPFEMQAFRCTHSDCSGAYGQKKLLDLHLRYVHGDKTFNCPYDGCEKSFSSRSALKHHQFVHTDTFRCSWPSCGKRFRDDYNLRTHYMIHTGTKPRQCSLCDYSCVQKNSMDWHMKTKHCEAS